MGFVRNWIPHGSQAVAPPPPPPSAIAASAPITTQGQGLSGAARNRMASAAGAGFSNALTEGAPSASQTEGLKTTTGT